MTLAPRGTLRDSPNKLNVGGKTSQTNNNNNNNNDDDDDDDDDDDVNTFYLDTFSCAA